MACSWPVLFTSVGEPQTEQQTEPGNHCSDRGETHQLQPRVHNVTGQNQQDDGCPTKERDRLGSSNCL